MYPSKLEKFKYINFGIDTTFEGSSEYNSINRKYILFEMIQQGLSIFSKTCKHLTNVNFKILSSRLNKNDFDFKNVEVIEGVLEKFSK